MLFHNRHPGGTSPATHCQYETSSQLHNKAVAVCCSYQLQRVDSKLACGMLLSTTATRRRSSTMSTAICSPMPGRWTCGNETTHLGCSDQNTAAAAGEECSNCNLLPDAEALHLHSSEDVSHRAVW